MLLEIRTVFCLLGAWGLTKMVPCKLPGVDGHILYFDWSVCSIFHCIELCTWDLGTIIVCDIRLVQKLFFGGFCIVEICLLILDTFLNKGSYIIHHFNVHFTSCFLDNDLSFAVTFTFILDYRNVRQEANSSNFLFEFKMDHEVAETTYNIKNPFIAQEVWQTYSAVMVQEVLQRR